MNRRIDRVYQCDAPTSGDDYKEQLHASHTQNGSNNVSAGYQSEQSGHQGTGIPGSIGDLLLRQPWITLREFHNHMPHRSTNRGRVIGLNKIRDYARLGLIPSVSINRQGLQVLYLEHVQKIFGERLFTDPRRMRLHTAWKEDHEALSPTDQSVVSLERSSIAREKLAVRYAELARKLDDGTFSQKAQSKSSQAFDHALSEIQRWTTDAN